MKRLKAKDIIKDIEASIERSKEDEYPASYLMIELERIAENIRIDRFNWTKK